MRTIEQTVYSVEELSGKARERAYSNWLQGFEYFWSEENKESLEEFQKYFPVNVTNWEYGYRNYIDFSLTSKAEEYDNLSFKRLYGVVNTLYQSSLKGKYYSKGQWVNGKYTYKHRYSKAVKQHCNCNLTGYWIDDSLLEPIRKWLANPCKTDTFTDIMADALNEWVNDCEKDFEYAQSEEAFESDCEANNWEFYENGEMV